MASSPSCTHSTESSTCTSSFLLRSSSLPPFLLLLFLLFQGAVQEEGQSCGVQSFVGCELRWGQRGELTRWRWRPQPPERAEREALHLQPLGSSCSLLLRQVSTTRGVVELFCESQLHHCAHVPLPRTQAALSAALSSTCDAFAIHGDRWGLGHAQKMLQSLLVCNRLDRDAWWW